ncbi:MAG: phosphoribosyl-ATP diphosphatase [Woeseiaceae bacterium]|nr:phosphoribosyl-ATP diphosphatase [Woeseiaceae bacterium]
MTEQTTNFLATLESIIRQRAGATADESYTAQLFASGTRRIAQKVGEEAVELSLAAVAGSRDEQLDEAADLLYHLLVLLADRDLRLADVVAVLESRHEPTGDRP